MNLKGPHFAVWIQIQQNLLDSTESASLAERDSPTRFSTPSFFHHSDPSGPLINRLKHFWILFRFRWDIRTLVFVLVFRKRTSRIMKKTGRNSRWTVPLNMIQKIQMTPRSMILCRTWLHAVWYCAELRKNSNISAKTKQKTNLF